MPYLKFITGVKCPRCKKLNTSIHTENPRCNYCGATLTQPIKKGKLVIKRRS